MFHARTLSRSALYALAGHLLISTAAPAAPYVAGDRLFPATPTTEDPFVADEVAARVSRIRHGAMDPDPAIRETGIGFALDKRITENLGVALEGGYTILDPAGQSSAYGFNNLEGKLKYQVYVSDRHEFLLSAGVTREFGGTGARRVGAESVSSTTPTIFFGKGFGDLTDELKYLRPFAVTGTFGYQFPDLRTTSTTMVDPRTGATSLQVDHHPDAIVIGFSLQYSLRYLQGNVGYVDVPTFISRLTPIVEFAYTTPASRSFGAAATGTIAPGVIYSDRGIDVGLEALIPATRQSGTGVGFIASLSVPLGRILPAVFGKPLFGD